MERYYAGNNGQLGFIAYNGTFTGAAFADFLLDQVSEQGPRLADRAVDASAGAAPRFYVADDYKVTDNLTLNLGLRWGYTSPLVEKDDRQANFDLTNAQQLLAGQNGNSRALYEPYYNGWEPRLGAAYRMGEQVGLPRRLWHHAVHGGHRREPAPAAQPAVLLRVAERPTTGPSGAGTISTGFEGLQALDRPSGVSCAPGIRTCGRSSRSSGTRSPSTCSARAPRSTSATSATSRPTW